MIDLATARETFEASADLTVGIEEEFAIVDPESLLLVPRFETLRDAGAADPVLADSIAGELISSEIEIRSGAGADVDDARARQADARRRLFALAAAQGLAFGATGTHPLSDYREQHIIDTEHYHRVEDGLKYVAWRNNTFSVHVHVGVRGADRAVRVCDRLRPVLPLLLAISANSPYIDGRDSGLHSGRSQTFTKSFPRCGIPDVFGSWDAWADYVGLLVRTGSIVEFTQLWWSVRPHHSFGTVEVRICDAQTTGRGVRRAGGADRRLRAPRGGRDRRGGDAARPARAADRGEHVARDPLRAGRPPAGPPGARDRGVRRRGDARPAQRLGRRGRRAAAAQRRAAPARADRGRRDAGGGVRGLRAGNPSHIRRGDRR